MRILYAGTASTKEELLKITSESIVKLVLDDHEVLDVIYHDPNSQSYVYYTSYIYYK